MRTESAQYSQVSRPLRAGGTAATQATLVVRSYDTVASIALPQGSDPAVQVTVTKAFGQVSLTIPPDSLMLADGSLAQGQVEARVSY